MELQFKGSSCRCLKPAAREVRSTELTQEVRLNDGMPDIGRVITSWGQIILRSKEWQSDQITVSGGVLVWILYVPEDGTPPRCIDTWVPFQLKWEAETTDREGPVRVSPLLRFVDSRTVSARKIMIRASVAAMGEALYPWEAETFSPEELPEDVQILQSTYPLRLPKEAGEKTFLLDEDLNMPAGAVPMERLLCYTIVPQIQEKRVAGDKVIIRGTGNLHVVYRCPEGRIRTEDFEVPISQYAQLENTYGTEGQADVQMAVTSLEMDPTETQQLRLKCGMVAQYLISDRVLTELTEDAYSPRRDVQMHVEELKLPVMMEQRTEMIPVHQQLTGICGETVDVQFYPDYPRQQKGTDRILLDLPGQFQVLYYAEDGSLQGAGGRWEGQMEIPADMQCRIDAIVQHHGKVQMEGRTSELNLNTHYRMQINATGQQGMNMVTGLQLGDLEEPDPARPSLILCRSEGESLWNMAKRCGSTMAEIRRLNGLTEEPKENRMLLIPVN